MQKNRRKNDPEKKGKILTQKQQLQSTSTEIGIMQKREAKVSIGI